MYQGTERRRYFRINDQVALGYAKLRSDAALVSERALLSLGARMDSLQNELRHELTVIADESPRLGRALQLLDRKLDLVVEMLDVRTLAEQESLSLEEVNLSASGISFPADEWFVPGERLLVTLVLPPDSQHVRLVARVVAYDKEGEGHRVRADFENPTQIDRDVLVQHVLRCQSVELRRRREGQKDPSDADGGR